MGDVDERDPDLALDLLELDLEALAQLQIEGAEGLVEQQHPRQIDQRACQRDALLHAAGELCGTAVRLGRQADPLQLLAHPLVDLALVDTLAPQAEGDVLLDGEVGEEGVALEDGVRRALVGRDSQHVDVVDRQAAAGDLLEARDHPQGRRLAAAAGPEHREELPLRDVEVDRVDRRQLAETLGDGVEDDAGVIVVSWRPPSRPDDQHGGLGELDELVRRWRPMIAPLSGDSPWLPTTIIRASCFFATVISASWACSLISSIVYSTLAAFAASTASLSSSRRTPRPPCAARAPRRRRSRPGA